jgi:hypothetical protein
MPKNSTGAATKARSRRVHSRQLMTREVAGETALFWAGAFGMFADALFLLRRFDMAGSTSLQIAETAIRFCCFLF